MSFNSLKISYLEMQRICINKPPKTASYNRHMQDPAPTLIPPILSVSVLNRRVREYLEGGFPLTWISGEISNLTFAASGHVYFSLKDEGAQVRCVMWRNKAQLLGWRPENGQRVEARALVSFYEPRGEFQLNVEALRRAGQGDLFERFLRLKTQLEAEGLLATDAKRPLPAFPRHVGIVTSPQAAALRDVLTTLKRRSPHLQITLFPTPVQGDGAGEKIAAALRQANTIHCDAIILCRGGGSIEDLWAFNEECVARAIRASSIPVICGVGHETDFTIADFAADLRAPTPTAAAELVSPDRATLLIRLHTLQEQMARRMARSLGDQQQRIDGLAGKLTHPSERIRQRLSEASALAQRLHQATRRQHESLRARWTKAGLRLSAGAPRPKLRAEAVKHLQYRLDSLVSRQISLQNMKLNALTRSLTQLDPKAVLSRGYALAIGDDGRIIRDATRLTPGTPLQISFAKGEVRAVIDHVVATPEAD